MYVLYKGRKQSILGQKTLEDTLKAFGLTDRETEIYIYLAKQGTQKISQISKALKANKGLVYRVLNSLQNKELVQVTLESPTRYIAVPFEKIIDNYIKTKREEAAHIEEKKQDLLSDWKKLNQTNLEPTLETFSVIEGEKKVFRKISQMVKETRKELVSIATVNGLIQAEKYGVLDTIVNHPSKSTIKFRYITNVNKENITSIKFLLRRHNSFFALKGKYPDLQDHLFTRLVIRDKEEIMLFINDQNQINSTNSIDAVLCTNCKSIIHPFYGLFEEIWNKSSDIEDVIEEIENGITPATIELIKEPSKVKKVYTQAFNEGKDVLIVTSSKGLLELEKNINLVKDRHKNGASTRILAPITSQNLEVANKLMQYCEIKHIPDGYKEITVVDSQKLFIFNDFPLTTNDVNKRLTFNNILYTEEKERILKTKKRLENIWQNSINPSHLALESIIDPIESITRSKPASKKPSSEVIYDYLLSKPVIYQTSPGELTEKEVIKEILSQEESTNSKKSIKCYCKIGLAAINPPIHLNLPKLLIQITQIDKKSSFGAEDRLVFHLWKETADGFKYVPVAIIGDNPNFPVEILTKGQYRNTPAAKNFHLLKREEIQFQMYGNTFLASWLVPIKLDDKLVLPPGTIILETYGKVNTKKVVLEYPNGAKYKILYNRLDSFITFMHGSSKYDGPGTDGLLLRDAFIEIYLPEQQKNLKK